MRKIFILLLVVTLLVFLYSGKRREDKECVPYDLRGFLVFVDDHSANKEYFAGHVLANYSKRSVALDTAAILAYCTAYKEDLTEWSYMCYTITSTSNSATKVRTISGQKIPPILNKYETSQNSVHNLHNFKKFILGEYMNLLNKSILEVGGYSNLQILQTIRVKIALWTKGYFGRTPNLITTKALQEPVGALISASLVRWTPSSYEIKAYTNSLPKPEYTKEANEILLNYILKILSVA